MSAYQIAAANPFSSIWGGYSGFGNATPFLDTQKQERDIRGSLMATGMAGQFNLKNQEMAGENALDQIEARGEWERRLNQDTIEANRATARRAGIAGLLAGSQLLGGGGGGGVERFAGTALSTTPFLNLQNTLTGFNNVTAGFNTAFDQTVGPWGRSRDVVARALQNMPRPPAVS
jgi:hypothetical protein